MRKIIDNKMNNISTRQTSNNNLICPNAPVAKRQRRYNVNSVPLIFEPPFQINLGVEIAEPRSPIPTLNNLVCPDAPIRNRRRTTNIISTENLIDYLNRIEPRPDTNSFI